MPLFSLPNELLLKIGECLGPGSLNSLLRTNRRLASLLTPSLYGIAIKFPSVWGVDALLSVAMNGNEELVRLLVERGLNNATKQEDCCFCFGLVQDYPLISKHTVFHIAAESGNETTVRLLLETGAIDIDAQNNLGRTALHMSVLSKGTGSLEFLLRKGANMNLVDVQNRTALHYAARSSTKAMMILLERGADHSVKDIFGQTPLHNAARWASADAVGILMKKGADTSARDNDGKTPLQMAASGHELKACARLLLGEGRRRLLRRFR